MLPASSYEHLINQLGQAFCSRYENKPRLFATGILFFQPGSDFAKREVMPHIPYVDANSANYIDFFCAGFEPIEEAAIRPVDQIAKNNDENWIFRPAKFTALKRALESDFSADKKSWRYSGGTDFLLFNAVFDYETQQAELAFETVMSVNLEEAKASGAISSVVSFFEEIVRLAERQDLNNPVFKISDQLGIKLGKKELWNVFYDVLPLRLGDKVKKFEHFATLPTRL